jgi:DNA polymerase III subunit delta'
VKLHGLDTQIAAFRSAMAGERMHHAWLLAGPRGVGKGSFADFAARLLLNASDPESQGASLIEAGSHPDFRRLERLPNEKTGNLARNITVDQVRHLRALFATGTSITDRRVIIIDSIDDMERGAANALLKSLEEPPASTIFLLVSHQPGRLLPTIRSRCRTLMFGPLDDAAMTSVLDEQLSELDSAKRAQLIASAGGSPAAALAYAELDIMTLDAALVALAQTGDPANAVRSKLAQSLSLKAALPRYEAFLDRAPAFIADHARQSEGAMLDVALTAWSKARALAQMAIPQSLVAETVVFEMAGHVASLAPSRGAAKA